MPFVDQHCHSLVHDWDRVAESTPRWRRCFTEAADPLGPASDVAAMRGYREFLRAFARYLSLDDAEADDATVASKRDERAREASYLPRLMTDAGLRLLLVDTGYGGRSMLGISAVARRAAVEVRPIVRVERLAEEVLDDGGAPATPARFGEAIAQAIADAIDAGAVGMKTIAAYRSGLELMTPSAAHVRRGLADRAAQARRLDDPALVALVVRTAAEIGAARSIPLQVHTGFGDTDLDLRASDPGLLRPLLRDARLEACPIVLLHCYPFVRQAAYLASVHANVHVDLSLTIPLLGAAGARRAISEALELCPVTKLLAGTDGHSYPEMHWRGAKLWREALAAVLGEEVAATRMGRGEARSAGEAILAGNARRLYRLT